MTIIIFAVIVICLSADLISLTEHGYPFGFSVLALSLGLLTIITIIPMCGQTYRVVDRITKHLSSFIVYRLVIDLLRQGSFFSYIVVEIAWLCRFFLANICYINLTANSDPLGPLVVKWILCRLDE